MNGSASATTVPKGSGLPDSLAYTLPGIAQLSDADLWEHYRARGLSGEQAQQHVLRRRQNRQAIADNPPPPVQTISPERAALLGAGRTATSGFMDELAGALDALRGPNPQNLQEQLFGALGGKPTGQAFDTGRYQQTRDQVREAQSQAAAEHPAMTIASGAVGAYANPLNFLLGPATQSMGPVAQGITTGATLGAAQGGGEGASGPDRVAQAVRDAALGAAIGGVGGVASKLWRAVFQRAPAKMTEAAVRTGLAKLKFTPQQADQAVGIWKQGGLLPGGVPKRLPTTPPPMVETPVAIRPGETTVTRAPADPLDIPTFMRRNTGRGLPVQMGGTVVPTPGEPVNLTGVATRPPPAMTGPLVPQQLALMQQFLQGATPAELGGRLSLLRALGIPLPEDAATQLAPLLFGGP